MTWKNTINQFDLIAAFLNSRIHVFSNVHETFIKMAINKS